MSAARLRDFEAAAVLAALSQGARCGASGESRAQPVSSVRRGRAARRRACPD
ncbi:MAG: hypothetical protein QN161_12330 [Armatimonadota bacterium]|nr:hypothetical protein [Armatimonadota bacterium]